MRVAAGAARAAFGVRRRADHRRADGERDRARGGAARTARAGADGTSRSGACSGAPPLRVLVGEEAHVTVWRALRLLGFGRAAVETIAVDGQGRDARRRARLGPRGRRGRGDRGRAGGQREHGRDRPADGASSPRPASTAPGSTSTAPSGSGPRRARRCRHLVAGAGDADSWATDGHKWLNVPYDCGVVAVRDRAAHLAAMGMTASYLVALRRLRSLQRRLGAGSVAPRARVRRLRGAPLARSRRGGRAGGPVLRARAAARFSGRLARTASRSSTTSSSTRCSCGFGADDDADGRGDRAACRPTGPAGSAGPAGAARRRCGSRCRAGPPPRPTSIAPPTRSCARQPSALLGQRRDHGLVDARAV